VSPLALPATLTLGEARATLRTLEEGVQQAADSPVTLDASALRDFDSSALAVLLGARRAAQAAGKALAVQGAPAPLVALAGLYGVAELLSLD
jgi:phospholipid transport system transporter-binding protein